MLHPTNGVKRDELEGKPRQQVDLKVGKILSRQDCIFPTLASKDQGYGSPGLVGSNLWYEAEVRPQYPLPPAAFECFAGNQCSSKTQGIVGLRNGEVGTTKR